MLLFTISLSGFLVTQFFWIRGAFTAAEQTFRQMSTTALRSAVQQTTRITNYHSLSIIGNRVHTDRSVTFDSILSPCGFDAVMQYEFMQYRLHEEYEYGIIDHLTEKLVYSSDTGDRNNRIMQSGFRHNLKRALDTERFSIVVWFPHEHMIILRNQKSWLLILSVLLFLGIIAGYFLSVAKLLSQKRIALIQRDFINNTTHEFKTPLATISIAAEMILTHRNSMPDKQIEQYAAIIFEENKRIQHQVDQILQLSLLENAMERFNMKPNSIQEIAEKCVEIGKLMLRDGKGEISLTGNCTTLVECDLVHVTNVINNLIENSIKYSREAPVIQLAIKELGEGVSIACCDQGIGIPKDQILRIFDRMYRVPSGDLYHTTGTGIGLYYVKRIMEAHHGSVSAQSTLGKGSCFTLFFPYTQPDR